MSSVINISGQPYLAPDDLLKAHIGKHRGVMLVAVDEDGAIECWSSDGFTNAESVFGARKLAYQVEHAIFPTMRHSDE